MQDKKPIAIFMPDQGEIGVLQFWYVSKQPKWCEVRGKNVRDYDPTCPFHKLHDLKTIDKSQLHANEIVVIQSTNPAYPHFAKYLDSQ